MKKIALLIFVAAAALFSSKVSAQGKFGPDSIECIKYLSYYTEYYKQKNYDAALPNWRKAYNICPPTARYSLLSDGTTLVRRLIQANAKNAAYKDQLIDSLMVIYDQRVEFWPKYAVSSLNNKNFSQVSTTSLPRLRSRQDLTSSFSSSTQQLTSTRQTLLRLKL